MKPPSTSREAILGACREIVRERGLSGISVRSVASACGVAVGTIYHYFPDKEALLLAVTADIWSDVFDPGNRLVHADGFADYVEGTFDEASRRLSQYPGFLSEHGLGLASISGWSEERMRRGRQRMRSFPSGIRRGLLDVLDVDGRIRPDVWDADLSREDFVEFVTQQLLTLLVLGGRDCRALLGVIKRTLY